MSRHTLHVLAAPLTTGAVLAAAGFAGFSRCVSGVAPRVIRHAARHAPQTLSCRLEEEWLADLSWQRGQLSRLLFALGCYRAAMTIKHEGCAGLSAISAHAGGTLITAPARHKPSPPQRHRTQVAAGAPLCDINTTPLIDVMLVLLVTLIMSLPLMTHAVKLDLPHGPPPSSMPPPEVIDLEIDSDGTVAWNGAAIRSLPQLESLLRIEARRNPQPEIHLRPDRRVKYAFVAKVLAAAQHNRMTKIGFVETADFKD